MPTCVLLVAVQVCHPYNESDLVWHPVTPAMSKPSYNGPDACADVRAKKGTITAFFGAAKPKPGSISSGTKTDKGGGSAIASASASVGAKDQMEAKFPAKHQLKEEDKSNEAAAEECGLNPDDQPPGAGVAACKKEEEQQQQEEEGAEDVVKLKVEEASSPRALVAGKEVAASPGSHGKRKQTTAAATGGAARAGGRGAVHGKRQKQH